MTEAPALPRLVALETWVRDEEEAEAFWLQHFALNPYARSPLSYEFGSVIWRMRPGAKPCGTKGPHGVMPTFGITDFGRARGTLLARGVPVVFAEMLPGANLLVFLDPSANPIELLQETDPTSWDIAHRRALWTRQREDAPQAGPLTLLGLQELTIYTHDITASNRFYRDIVGLPTGLAYFGHVHLAADNVPVVLRHTNKRCQAPRQRHGTEPVFAVPAWEDMQSRLQTAAIPYEQSTPQRLTVLDPIGLHVHFQSLSAE